MGLAVGHDAAGVGGFVDVGEGGAAFVVFGVIDFNAVAVVVFADAFAAGVEFCGGVEFRVFD